MNMLHLNLRFNFETRKVKHFNLPIDCLPGYPTVSNDHFHGNKSCSKNFLFHLPLSLSTMPDVSSDAEIAFRPSPHFSLAPR